MKKDMDISKMRRRLHGVLCALDEAPAHNANIGDALTSVEKSRMWLFRVMVFTGQAVEQHPKHVRAIEPEPDLAGEDEHILVALGVGWDTPMRHLHTVRKVREVLEVLVKELHLFVEHGLADLIDDSRGDRAGMIAQAAMMAWTYAEECLMFLGKEYIRLEIEHRYKSDAQDVG